MKVIVSVDVGDDTGVTVIECPFCQRQMLVLGNLWPRFQICPDCGGIGWSCPRRPRRKRDEGTLQSRMGGHQQHPRLRRGAQPPHVSARR